MTREQAKQLLPIIQAFADGDEVEYQTAANGWAEALEPNFNCHFNWRIKPKPVKGWVNIYPPDCLSIVAKAADYIYRDRSEADRVARPHRIACVEVEFTPA